MNTMHRFLCLIGICLFALVGCIQSQDPETSSVVLRLGYRPKALADVTPVIIEEAGLSMEGLTIQLVPLSSPADAFQKFAVGEVDAIAGIPLEPIFQQIVSESSPAFEAYVLQVDKTGEGWVSIVVNADAGISSITDLAGKTVASLPTTQAQYLLKKILMKAGIAENDIRVVAYNPTTPLIGMQSGEHAAIFGLEPAVSLALQAGYTLLEQGPISHWLYQDRPIPVSASLISKDFIEKHPQTFHGFLAVIEQAMHFANEHPAKVRHYFMQEAYGGLSEAVAESFFLPVMEKPNAALLSVTEEYIHDLVQDGQLPRTVNIAPLFPIE